VEAHGDNWTHPDNIATNGAFHLAARKPRERVILKRNSKYHGRSEGNVESARRSINQEERIHMYTEAQQILIDEVPIFPLTYNRGHALLKPWISQYPINTMWWNDWKNVVIKDHD
jgi:ABC-type oligopeptide transport system substrate-binding subunit